MSRNSWVFVTIIIIFALSLIALLVNPIKIGNFTRSGIVYGLDLEGGVRLVYKADLTGVEESNEKEVVNDVIAVIANRVNPLGVTEPNIEHRGADQIVVELPMPKGGLTEVQKERIGRTALLEFRELVQTLDADGNVIEEEWIPATGTYNGETKVLNSSLFKTNTELRVSSLGAVELYFEWNEEGAALFKEITTRLLNKPLGIYEGSGNDALPLLGEDGKPITPIVQTVLTNDGVVTGLSRKEAAELSQQLNAGRIPVPLELIGEKLVDPSLGTDFIKLSVRAGIIGIAAVMLFLIAYYRVPGVVAALALAFYGALTLAIFKLIPVTMTLSGIGGFVLSMGMAIDANVLIFERMKEELLAKTTLSSAMESGFSRAWTAIWDSNVTTIIACLVLYWVGDTVAFGGTVKGFALTLGIGVLVSMFTAVLASHTLLRMVVRTGLSKQTELFKPYTGRRLA
ncbi:MAG TPA: protein translocase subunit SecD [Dehalococcoidales bacterium]